MTNPFKPGQHLSSERMELLELLLKREGTIGTRAAFHEKSDSGAFSLSYGQKALWFLQQLQPQSSAYNIVTTVRVKGDLDLSALRYSFDMLIDRHQLLRATFPVSGGIPLQKIGRPATDSSHVFDTSELGEEELYELLRTEARRPFDLELGPLIRIGVFGRPAREHVLQLVVHHIVSDLWSMVILFNEFGALYQARTRGTQAILTPLPMQFADYVSFQAEMLAGPDGDKSWAYWSQRLAGDLPIMNLPADRSRPDVQTFAGDSHSLKLSHALTLELKSLAARLGITMYSLMLAAYFVLLHRLTGQIDIVVGSPTSGRTRADFDGLVGYFVNPVVLRADLSGDPGFLAFLERVCQTVLDAFDHQDYPLALLAERLHPVRDVSRSPLFQTMFVFQKAQLREQQNLMAFVVGEAGAAAEIGGLPVEFMPVYKGTSQFDLRMTVAEVDDVMATSLNGNTDLFDSLTIRRFLDHFQTLLENIVAHPEQALSKLRILGRNEEEQLLRYAKGSTATAPPARCVHEFFEVQADRTPCALAVVCEQEELTYGELNNRANQLAHYLRRLGVGPEKFIGICLERSADMIVAMLGVLKAGGAYVPLDPSYPKERMAYLLQDASATAVLTQQRLAQRLPVVCPIVQLDVLWRTISNEAIQNPPALATPSNIAYLIYTSGSTGIPKGVAIEHRSTIGLIWWAGGQYTSDDRAGVLASSSICFDCQLFEVFCTLSWGGTVILVERILDLPFSASANRITLIAATPTAVAELLRVRGVPSSVRVVNLSGEALSPTLPAQLYQETSVQKVFNLYGASEASTYSTCALIPRAPNATVTVGQPIAGTRIYVLDSHRKLVPFGVVGELYIGGSGLARGYLNRPELTAERFNTDPFSVEPFARLYQTGDLARYLSDGSIQYYGRMDYQVKVRGFRVEPGEIEAVIRGHPAVLECVVMARFSSTGDQYLAAYVLAAADSDLMAGELRRFATKKLPAYMLPSAFMVMTEFPLMPNGKVDRGAFPAPEISRSALNQDYVAPRNRTEGALAQIWEQILGTGPIGVHNDFFDLGGHSLLATQIISRAQGAFGVQVPLKSFFSTPTVAGLADSITRSQNAPVPTNQPMTRVPRDRELPLSFAQEQRLEFEQWAAERTLSLKPFQTLVALRLKGPLDRPLLEQSLNEIVRRHEVFRTTFHRRDGKAFQRIAPAAALKVAEIDTSTISEAEVLKLAIHEAEQSFDLSKSLPVRATLLDRGHQHSLLLLTIHHIVFDGWSQGVLLREWAALYGAFLHGFPSPLPEPVIEYVDFASWQREFLQGPVLEDLLSYWKQQLDGMGPIPEIELPGARSTPPAPTYAAAGQFLALSTPIGEELKELSRQSGVTLFMLFLAVLNVWLHRLSGKTDLGVVAPVANRNRLETEMTLGWFANHLVFRSDLSGNPRFKELLGRTRQVALDAFAHQDLPFPKLLDAFEYWNQPRRPYVFFNMPPVGPFESQHVGDLVITPVELNCVPGIAEPGIEVHVVERAQGFEIALVYEAERFDHATATRWMQQFQSLLEGIIKNPEQRLSDLPFLRAS